MNFVENGISVALKVTFGAKDDLKIKLIKSWWQGRGLGGL